MIQIAPDRWVNPRYIVGAVLHDGTNKNMTNPKRTLTLTLDGSTNTPDQYLDITGLWIGQVMSALGLADDPHRNCKPESCNTAARRTKEAKR